jgi:hypothetical protein
MRVDPRTSPELYGPFQRVVNENRHSTSSPICWRRDLDIGRTCRLGTVELLSLHVVLSMYPKLPVTREARHMPISVSPFETLYRSALFEACQPSVCGTTALFVLQFAGWIVWIARVSQTWPSFSASVQESGIAGPARPPARPARRRVQSARKMATGEAGAKLGGGHDSGLRVHKVGRRRDRLLGAVNQTYGFFTRGSVIGGESCVLWRSSIKWPFFFIAPAVWRFDLKKPASDRLRRVSLLEQRGDGR